MLPAGNYRESIQALIRAQMVVITKVDFQVTSDFQKMVRKKLNLHINQQLYFSQINYEAILPVYNILESPDLNTIEEVYLLTGIANTFPLLNFLHSKGIQVIHHQYPDHHIFTKQNISKLVSGFDESKCQRKILLTTEKDCQRLKSKNFEMLLTSLPFYYLPIHIEIIPTERKDFESRLFDYVNAAI